MPRQLADRSIEHVGETVNIYQAMRLTGRSRRTIHNWIAAGIVLAVPGENPSASARIYVSSLPEKGERQCLKR